LSNPKESNLIVAPHLPIGSPERAAFFRESRRTFSEDWEAAERAVVREAMIAKGDLYFVRAGDAVKIGHTANIVNRLGKMQADNHEKLDCLVLLRGRGHEEKRWHKDFAATHIRGEWFLWSPELERAMKTAAASLAPCLDGGE